MIYRFTVLGHPISKSNFKPATRGGYFSPQGKKFFEYEKSIKEQVSKQMKDNGWNKYICDIQMLIVTYKLRNKGDISNYSKSLCDGLQEVLYDDDKCIKFIGLIDGGVDKINPRVDILTAPMRNFDMVQLGDLAYILPKTFVIKKEKVTKKIDSNICPTCNVPYKTGKSQMKNFGEEVMYCSKCNVAKIINK